MHYQGNYAGQGTNDVRHGDDQGQGHDGSTTSVAEQHHYAWRLIATAQRLTGTAAALGEAIVEGEVVVDGKIARPAPTAEPPWIREHRW